MNTSSRIRQAFFNLEAAAQEPITYGDIITALSKALSSTAEINGKFILEEALKRVASVHELRLTESQEVFIRTETTTSKDGKPITPFEFAQAEASEIASQRWGVWAIHQVPHSFAEELMEILVTTLESKAEHRFTPIEFHDLVEHFDKRCAELQIADMTLSGK